MITQSTNANMIPGQVSPRVNVSQYDKKSRTLSFTLYNGSQPFNISNGMAVTIEGTKPDNTGFQYAMIATAGSNVVSISIEQQMTVIAGDVPCEIVVSNAGKRLASANFILVVEPAALNENTIISETELPLIEKAAELAENIAIYVTTIHEDALKAEGYAVGKQNGVDVGSGSEYFHNNAKYHKEQAAISATNASNAASTASNAASTATTKASQATSAASTATSKASEATTAAQTATTKASEASASAQTAQEAAESFDSLKETFAKNGAHNLLPMSLANIKAINTNGTWSNNVYNRGGVNFTVNTDSNGNVTDISLNGTAETNLEFHIINQYTASGKGLGLPQGSYILSGGKSQNKRIFFFNGSQWYNDTTGNGIEFSISGSETRTQVTITIVSGETFSNEKFYPMVRSASDTDSTFEPYAMTNRELTNAVNDRISAESRAWPGDTLIFKNLPKSSGRWYEFTACVSTGSSYFVKGYIILREDNSINVNGKQGDFTVAYNQDGDLVITLPVSSYWLYDMRRSSGGLL